MLVIHEIGRELYVLDQLMLCYLLVACDHLVCLFWLLVGMKMCRNLTSTNAIPRFVVVAFLYAIHIIIIAYHLCVIL